jgi:hypothetical protein
LGRALITGFASGVTKSAMPRNLGIFDLTALLFKNSIAAKRQCPELIIELRFTVKSFGEKSGLWPLF